MHSIHLHPPNPPPPSSPRSQKSLRIFTLTNSLETCSKLTASTFHQMSQVSSNSKMVSWAGVSIDVDAENTSDSGRGTEILERETKPNLDGGEKISIKVPAGIKGKNSKASLEIS